LSCSLAGTQKVQQTQDPEGVLEEFFNLQPKRNKMIEVLKNGAGEPFKTKIIEKILAEEVFLSGEEASDILSVNPGEPHARRLWVIAESKGTLWDWCKTLSSGPEEYHDKAFALIFGRQLIIEEYVFYLMRLEYQLKYTRQIWDNFMKLNPGKEGLFTAAKSAKGDFQEIAVLQLLSQGRELKLTISEFSEIIELIIEIEKKRMEKKERGLIEIITRKRD
jgi:hypothetical protein